MSRPTIGPQGVPRVHAWLLVLTLLLCASPVASAASLQVAPTRIAIEVERGAEGLTLSNSGADVVHVQVRAFRWWQENGEDMLEPAEDLVVSPPMLQLGPGAEQLIRIVHTGSPPPAGGEKTYRVVVDELPVDSAGPRGPGLRFALRYSIPVFILESADAPPAPQLQTRFIETATGAAIQIRNSGSGSAQFADLVVIDPRGRRHVVAQGLAGYVLPGQQRQWPLPRGATAEGRIEAKLNGEPQARALAPDR